MAYKRYGTNRLKAHDKNESAMCADAHTVGSQLVLHESNLIHRNA
jgi:hypothetical protein